MAAQDLRTPGKIKSLLHIWRRDIPQQAHETLAECAEFLQNKPELVKALPKHTVAVSYTHLDVYKRQLLGYIDSPCLHPFLAVGLVSITNCNFVFSFSALLNICHTGTSLSH